MDIQRTITIVIEPDRDLQRTAEAFRDVQQALSEPCSHDGKPLGTLALQKACDHTVKATLHAHMILSALRLVAGASVRSKKKPATRPFLFKKARAWFLVGKRGHDADFRQDGKLSLWTVGGRKRLTDTVPEDFNPPLERAKEIDRLTVLLRNGQLIGRLTLTLDAPDPQGILPVGIDLNETNALVAVDPDGRERFLRGRDVKSKNTRTLKTRKRLQQKLAARKAQHKETRRVRRVMKRPGRKQRNRTRTFAQQTAKQLVMFSPRERRSCFRGVVPSSSQERGLEGQSHEAAHVAVATSPDWHLCREQSARVWLAGGRG